MLNYLKLIKPVGITILVSTILYLSYDYGFNKAEVYYENILKDQALKHLTLLEQENKRNNLIQQDLIDKQSQLRDEYDNTKKQLNKSIKESTDQCLSSNIPDDIVEWLRK